MADYRIVAGIDPQTAAGANKVKQDLRGIQSEAKATENALNRSFDQQKFDRTIGALVTRIESLDKTMKGLTATQAGLARANETTGQSLDRMAASQARSTAATSQGAKATGEAAAKQTQYEAALRRVLAAVDQDAAEQHRLNMVLADAKRLYDAGVISAERYAQVQKVVQQQTATTTGVVGAQRLGFQQLGFQLGDIATMYSLGAKPTQIFASQIGQVVQAVQLMTNGTSKFAAFLGGPWGIALTLATIVLTPFVAKLFEGNDALKDSIDKLAKDARETELNRQAKEAFNRTLEGQIALQKELNKELEESIKSQRQVQQDALRSAQTNLANLRTGQADALQDVKDAEDRLTRLEELFRKGPPIGTQDASAWTQGLLMGIERAEAEVTRLKGMADNAGRAIAGAERNVRLAQVPIVEAQTEALVDPVKAVEERFGALRDTIVNTFAAGNMSADRFRTEMERLRREQAAATDQAQKQKRAVDDLGVSVFRSRQQAIGVAGRELQQSGLRVGENVQFGGVKGNHPGMGNANHGQNAIDVNSGTGVVEADVPDIRAQFDALARRYQARGFRVLWNGWVYEANGNGPTSRIPAGQHQHRDHMHVEAPSTIVGKPTGASTEAQARQEEQEAQNREARAADFVQGIVDKAASVGLPSNRQTQLAADIDEAFAEFQRRFDRAPDFMEKWKISSALSDAEARAQAEHFTEAYVEPLERLTALQGKTGLEREILNTKLEETLRLGRELTPVEEQMIENGIRQADQLEREAQILQEVNGPLEQYASTIAALNGLLDKGAISQTAYNARLAELAQAAAATTAGVSGIDPNTGMSYSDLSATADENARYAAQLEAFTNHRDELLRLGIDYDALEENARRQHVENLAKIDQARKDQQLQAAEDIFGSLTSIAENTAGKQSAIWRALFMTEKAVAIARSIVAIQTGIAQASALPFPANLGAIASVVAATASIVSNIRAVTLNFADGGYVNGPGGPRSDSVAANLSNGEFVVNAEATARHRSLLEAINSGRSTRSAAGAFGGGSPTVNVAAAPAPQVNIKNINVLDPSIVGDYLATPEGDQVMVNWLNKHPELVQGLAGRG